MLAFTALHSESGVFSEARARMTQRNAVRARG